MFYRKGAATFETTCVCAVCDVMVLFNRKLEFPLVLMLHTNFRFIKMNWHCHSPF